MIKITGGKIQSLPNTCSELQTVGLMDPFLCGEAGLFSVLFLGASKLVLYFFKKKTGCWPRDESFIEKLLVLTFEVTHMHIRQQVSFLCCMNKSQL